MNYELSIGGKRVGKLSKARSIVDYHLLKNRKNQSFSHTTFNFEEPPPSRQSISIKSRRVLSSYSKRSNERSGKNH